jgi:hypothetical protein
LGQQAVQVAIYVRLPLAARLLNEDQHPDKDRIRDRFVVCFLIHLVIEVRAFCVLEMEYDRNKLRPDQELAMPIRQGDVIFQNG